MTSNSQKAKRWAEIYVVLEKKNYFSMAGFISIAESAASSLGIKWNEMRDYINQANKEIDFEVSDASFDVYWKKDKEFDKATEWFAIANLMKKEGYLSLYGVSVMYESIKRNYNLTSEQVSQKLNLATKNIDMELSNGYVDVHMKEKETL